MRPLYAIQFEVGDASLQQIVDEVKSWIAGVYDEDPEFDAADQPAPDLTASAVSWVPAEGHELESKLWQVESGLLYETTWRKPADITASGMHEQVELTLLEGGGPVEVAVRVSAEQEAFRIAPLDVGIVQRPRIVDRLVRHFECRVNETPIHWYNRTLDCSDVDTFLRTTLENAQRAIPVVLVSRSSRTETPVEDAEWLQNRLLGLAHVYEISSEVSRQLTEQLGRVRSCRNGAVRLYWPGFSRRAVPRGHPLFTADSLKTNRKRGVYLEDVLFRMVTRVAAEQFGPSPQLRTIRRQIREARRQHLLETTEELPDEWLSEFEFALSENDRLAKENESLQRQLDQAKENLRYVQEAVRSSDDVAVAIAPDRTGVQSPLEALELAEALFGQQIYVWKSARKAAAEAIYHQPAEIVDTLEAIAELVKLDAARDGRTGPWSKFFAMRGIKYAAHESDATMNRYGDERTFHDGGETTVMQRHITIGQGHDHCLQIYFDRSDDDSRFQIGYCGEHLNFISNNT